MQMSTGERFFGSNNMDDDPIVKCKICKSMFTSSDMQNHLLIHLNPTYLKPVTKPNVTKFDSYLLDQTTNSDQSDDIAIQSLMPSQIPRNQSTRKKVQPPMTIIQFIEQYPNDYKMQIKSDTNDLVSNLIIDERQPDSIEMIPIQKKIDMKKNKVEVSGKKTIHVYENSKFSNQRCDHGSSNSKPVLEQKLESKAVYQMVESKTNPQQTVSKSLRVPVNMQKHPHTKINTISTKLIGDIYDNQVHCESEQFSENYQGSKKNQEVPLSSRPDQSPFTSEFQCQKCHGFHCKTCNSTIPPKYRPYNLEGVSEEIKQFYEEHVYKNQKCQDCENRIH